MNDDGAEAWARRLDLEPHPEGGFYREIYRSDEIIARPALPSRFPGARPFSTSIYFLLSAGQVSRLHRLRSDEIWHLYEGGPAVLHILDPEWGYRRLVLGRDPEKQEAHQHVLRMGWWFGAELAPEAPFVLAGCTLAPGFEFADFELGRREVLRAAFPAQAAIIDRLALA
ncbi:MAG: cupin domain-containing protein [Candidatus Aminicenantes bacterium]|nr:cupin domain-containing protein [Candidatus Aminicenantes bacterium]